MSTSTASASARATSWRSKWCAALSTASSASSMPTPASCSSRTTTAGMACCHACCSRPTPTSGWRSQFRPSRIWSSSASAQTSGRYSLYINTYRGTPIAIGDDDTVPVTLARPFNFQGQARNSVFVNSNGSLSFGAGDTSFQATVPAFLAGPPRISPLWTDLDPTGFLGNPGVVVVDANARPAAVHFVSVSEFFSSNPNYFTAELRDQGGITLKWGPTARGAGLVGVTQGGGAADPGPTRPEQARTASERNHVRELPVQHLDERGQQLRPLLRRDQEQVAGEVATAPRRASAAS